MERRVKLSLLQGKKQGKYKKTSAAASQAIERKRFFEMNDAGAGKSICSPEKWPHATGTTARQFTKVSSSA
jgi:hypothetical protein